ncbi:RluA family pseudouridine synthase [Aurantimonas sp. C2-6-R+9]|uniref:RluA family pseudouridine synthase n=2 Tax=unclassified Aurantimonas TaxID=2638230 RepID=UPI002E1988CD|nr:MULTISPECIES: RluA family pseudouridine synthase [unclassified Aurantimonas]MEC5289224.1 RluA family pseudouridine synthase [Aurantimonas sp. C2-3-R2]MEC5380140.1 RluA family pseudouridine synthase [Aurantimonas sp. C2-6-R+9]
MDTRRFMVDTAGAGERLDSFLAAASDGTLSRSRAKTLISEGRVSINGENVLLAKRKLSAGEAVDVDMPPPTDAAPEAEAIPLCVVHEDADLIVIDKPAGLVVHPGPGNWTGTLVNALLHHCGDSLSGIGGVRRPGIVHRLDKETSGLLVVAKSDTAHRGLSEQFAAHGRDGRLSRAYLAIVWGTLARPRGTVDAALGRSASDRVKRAVVPEGRSDARHAITRYTLRAASPLDGGLASLVECVLETGRTHQIRVHMAHIGQPLVGDDVYGAGFRTKSERLDPDAKRVVQGFRRQALHAHRLGFVHPVSGAPLSFQSPLPEDMVELCAAFGIAQQ